MSNMSQQSLSQATSKFGQSNSPDLNNASVGFLQSNSFVAKFGFLVLIIIAFFVILAMSVNLLGALLTPTGSPHLIDGMIDGTQQYVVPQNPNINGAKPVQRSDNQGKGIEFTWSIWVYIKDLGVNQNYYNHIFHKGNPNIQMTNCGENCGLNVPNNAPGLYIHPNKNSLLVIMNTFSQITEEIQIDDIPLNKWVNVMIRCEQNVVDVYINGAIAKRHKLNSVPKQNYDDVYMSMNGGFNGYSSNLWYFDKALQPGAILNVVKQGPNTNMLGGNNSLDTNVPPYFSLRWYFQKNKPEKPKGSRGAMKQA